MAALYLHDLGVGDQLLAGGLFWEPHYGMAAWDGQDWSQIGSPLEGDVFDFLRFDDGNGEKLYIVGNLYVGGDDLWHVARLDDGTWTFLDHGDITNSVNRMAVWDDGTGPGLYVTGDFDTLDGVTTHNGIARWDGTQWHPLNGGMTSVNFPNIGLALEVFDDGSGEQLYLGGTFQRVDGMPFFYLARWDGSEWSDVGNGQPNLSVTDMCVHDDGSGTALYIVGDFSGVAGMEMNHVARWDGIEWSDLDRGTQRQSSGVNACAVFDDGSGPALYISGGISEASGKPMCNIARWDGTEWHNPAGGLDCTGNQGAFAMLGLPPDSPFGPSMFVGGSFSQAGGQATNFIAEYRGCYCRADLDGNGILTTQDFLTYLNLWVARDPVADWNTDGTINTQDFLAYLNEWVAGCG
ncbi:MAG: hypothetical protein HND58_09400 [Planctomycetota bacterium]|nr:MAG: hypothetical protein HND58_09400 [Planctomycetota bacterium]